jgi:hypothetical protein
VAQRQLHSKWLKDQGILATGSSSKRAFSFLSSSMAFTSEKCPPRNFEPLAGRKLKLQYHQHPPFRASVILIFLKLTTAKPACHKTRTTASEKKPTLDIIRQYNAIYNY